MKGQVLHTEYLLINAVLCMGRVKMSVESVSSSVYIDLGGCSGPKLKLTEVDLFFFFLNI